MKHFTESFISNPWLSSCNFKENDNMEDDGKYLASKSPTELFKWIELRAGLQPPWALISQKGCQLLQKQSTTLNDKYTAKRLTFWLKLALRLMICDKFEWFIMIVLTHWTEHMKSISVSCYKLFHFNALLSRVKQTKDYM